MPSFVKQRCDLYAWSKKKRESSILALAPLFSFCGSGKETQRSLHMTLQFDTLEEKKRKKNENILNLVPTSRIIILYLRNVKIYLNINNQRACFIARIYSVPLYLIHKTCFFYVKKSYIAYYNSLYCTLCISDSFRRNLIDLIDEYRDVSANYRFEGRVEWGNLAAYVPNASYRFPSLSVLHQR
ncbi:hypothetical protein PUN28_006961 [Cardiocondyla obscurior]|uniref:Uncharacterized protein n=1 Tax=Cardiocondyla obscurior TaxID=286306 RepID=A0AAW2G2N7_9HYME